MGINNALVTFADAWPGVNRIRAVQQALDRRSDPVYLEIGLFRKWSAGEGGGYPRLEVVSVS